MLGPSFLAGLVLAVAAYVTLFYRALHYRRKVWVHAGYMLATPLILFESPFSRVLGGWVPAFMVHGPQDFGRIMPSILWSMALELLFIAIIWWRYREKARPFLVAGLFIVGQMLAMGLMQDVAILKSLLGALGAVPSAAIVMTGFAIGAATSWSGWVAGRRPGPSKLAQPA